MFAVHRRLIVFIVLCLLRCKVVSMETIYFSISAGLIDLKPASEVKVTLKCL